MSIWPEYDRQTADSLISTVASRRWAVATAGGTWPRRIGLAEEQLAELFGCGHAVAVCNGSAALVVGMQALGVKRGDRVLLPAFAWVGCITAILRLGATPVLCDTVDDRLSATMVEPVYEDIDAIIAIPLYAETVDLGDVRAAYPYAKIVCDLSHLSCSPALGDPLENADIIISSLQASKVLTCGEGGFVGTNDPKLAKRMEALRTDGRVLKQDELVPHGSVHGANYAMSEISAGLLLDQIQRLESQRVRRAEAAKFFLQCLDGLGLNYFADDAVVDGGLHYGIPVESLLKPTEMLDRVFAELGIRLDLCYPSMMEGPLCSPGEENRYDGILIGDTQFTNAQNWHDSLVLIPQEVFLLPIEVMKPLADFLATGVSTPEQVEALDYPNITVVMVSDAQRATIEEAILSIDRQSYPGLVKVLCVLDRCDKSELIIPPCSLPIEVVRIDLNETVTITRVARLRDLALRLCDSELICFLDDDNSWASDHLESLFDTMRHDGTKAVHSWRRLIDQDGCPWDGLCFPWLERDSLGERRAYELCSTSGIILKGEDVVRDTASIEGQDSAGMVDLGAWLIQTELLRTFGLTSFPIGDQRPSEGIGEDDILLSQFKAAHVPISCSLRPTLNYRLGGFSNDATRRGPSWGSCE